MLCPDIELTVTGACSLECWAYGSRTITKWYQSVRRGKILCTGCMNLQGVNRSFQKSGLLPLEEWATSLEEWATSWFNSVSDFNSCLKLSHSPEKNPALFLASGNIVNPTCISELKCHNVQQEKPWNNIAVLRRKRTHALLFSFWKGGVSSWPPAPAHWDGLSSPPFPSCLSAKRTSPFHCVHGFGAT